MNIIEVASLTKIFDDTVRAVDDVSFSVKQGEILGFLGPNGAGKTTTLNMLSTLLQPTSGTASVNGYNILKDPDAVRRSIGFVFQDPTLDIELTGRENLDFHGRIYGLKRDVRQQRVTEILQVVQLTDRADDLVKTYSGGMKRRLEIARGLLHYPQVLFLDEPTLGLDPQTRRAIWTHIQRLNQEENVTIILTTHYTEEADYLCDRILIIDLGKVVALDTPAKLKARLKGDIVSLTFKASHAIPKVHQALEQLEWIQRIDVVADGGRGAVTNSMMQMMRGMGGGGMGGMMSAMGSGGGMPGMGHQQGAQHPPPMPGHGVHGVMNGPRRLNLLVDDAGHRIPELVKVVDGAGAVLDSVEMHQPTLDDVFLSVTGRNIRDERGSFVESIRRHRIIRHARGQRVPG